MTLVLTEKQIISTFVAYLTGVLPAGVYFCWNLTTAETSGLTRWVDAYIPSSRRRTQRKNSPDQRIASFVVRVFQKSTGNDLDHWRLVRKIVPELYQKEIPIRDFASMGEPVVGGIRLQEVKSENKTRDFNGRGEANSRAQDLSQLARTNVKVVLIHCMGTLQS